MKPGEMNGAEPKIIGIDIESLDVSMSELLTIPVLLGGRKVGEPLGVKEVDGQFVLVCRITDDEAWEMIKAASTPVPLSIIVHKTPGGAVVKRNAALRTIDLIKAALKAVFS